MLDERGLYERMSLEAFQSGLSWRTILAKRDAFRVAFANLPTPPRLRVSATATSSGCFAGREDRAQPREDRGDARERPRHRGAPRFGGAARCGDPGACADRSGSALGELGGRARGHARDRGARPRAQASRISVRRGRRRCTRSCRACGVVDDHLGMRLPGSTRSRARPAAPPGLAEQQPAEAARAAPPGCATSRRRSAASCARRRAARRFSPRGRRCGAPVGERRRGLLRARDAHEPVAPDPGQDKVSRTTCGTG